MANPARPWEKLKVWSNLSCLCPRVSGWVPELDLQTRSPWPQLALMGSDYSTICMSVCSEGLESHTETEQEGAFSQYLIDSPYFIVQETRHQKGLVTYQRSHYESKPGSMWTDSFCSTTICRLIFAAWWPAPKLVTYLNKTTTYSSCSQQFGLGSAGWFFWSVPGLAGLGWTGSGVCSPWVCCLELAGLW